MNNIWSAHVQGIETLYQSRKLRFDDFFYSRYEPFFSLDTHKKLKILEIGCGPGALAAALHRWYPNAEIAAVDRDSNFIRFARENIPGVSFVEGDATALPFEADTFDVTISNTVCEYIEPALFFAEQRRVLKNNGVCLVLSVRKSLSRLAECVKMSEVETDFWENNPGADTIREKYGIGKYSMTEQEFPIIIERSGFINVSTGFAVIDLTPDNPQYSPQMAEDMINAERVTEIEAAQMSKSESVDRIVEIINKKYDNRIQLYRKGEKQWDTHTSVIMILRGIKKEA